MDYYQWHYFSKKKFLIKLLIVIILIPIIFFILLLLEIFNFITFIVGTYFFIFILICLYQFDIKYKLDAQNIIIPIHKNSKFVTPPKSSIVNPYYLHLIEMIIKGLDNNNIQYEKTIDRKIGGMLPFIIKLKFILNDITIKIVRQKYIIEISVTNVTNNNEIFFEQELKKIIDKAINDIENPFYKH